MNKLAGKRIRLDKPNDGWYDYSDYEYNFNWLKNWLKDFREGEE